MGRRRRASGRPIDGLLLLDKPIGPTSHTACDRARRALGAQKAGHTGTLDPMASGLLEICLGRATRLVQYLQSDVKCYRATVRLGAGTDTLDAQGQVVVEDPAAWVEGVTAAHFAAALPAFLGTIEQRPPAYSAIKVDGQRLHALARAGEAVEAPMRTVEIHALHLIAGASPDFTFEVTCGKGTYVRSLARDISAALGGHGHLVALRRLSNGQRAVEAGIGLEALEASPAQARVLTLAEAVSHLPDVALDARGLADVRHGRTFEADAVEVTLGRVLEPNGDLVALVSVGADGQGQVVRGFAG